MMKMPIKCIAIFFLCIMSFSALAAEKNYPADFPAGSTLQQAIDDGTLAAGDTLLVNDYGPDSPFKGINNAKGLIIRATTGLPLIIRGDSDDDFVGGDKLVLNHQGGTIDNFTIEADFTNVAAAHDIVFAGDNGGIWLNCTFRIVNNNPAASGSH